MGVADGVGGWAKKSSHGEEAINLNSNIFIDALIL
jgi:hypothetical protein